MSTNLKLEEHFSDGESLGVLISSSRQEMYQALELFYNHVKHTLSLMFTVLTAVLAIFGFTIKEGVIETEYFEYVVLLGSILFFLLFPLGLISSRITNRYYRLYVSSVIFSVKLHASVNLAFHPWFISLKEDLEDLDDNKKIKEVVDSRTNGKGHSWYLYSILIKSIGFIGFIGFIGLLMGLFLFISFLSMLNSN